MQTATAPNRRFSELRAPRGLPVVGSMLALALDAATAHLSIERWARELGTPFRVRLGSRYMLVIDDAAEIARIMKARPGVFRRVRPLESVFAEMGITGVFSAEGADWERQRRLVMRAFDPTKLRHYFPSLERVTERLKNRFIRASSAGEWLDLQAEFMRYTVDVTAGLAFGVDTNTIESGEDRIQAHLDKIFPAINRRMTAPFAYWRSFKLPSDRLLDADLAKVREAIDGFIAQARARMAQEPDRVTNPRNLIEALLAARDSSAEHAAGFTDADVSGNVFTALLAGEDTTANTLAWLCHYLCQNKALQERLRREVEPIMTATHDDAMQAFMDADTMPWLDACVKEAMRLKPVAVLLSHETNEATEIQGISVRPRTPVCTLMRPAGMQKDLFPQPEAFLPQRWVEPQSLGLSEAQVAQAKRVLMPFGAGPRFCPGRYLAMLEIKMVATMMVSAFELESDGKPVTERYALSMMPSGLRVRLHALKA